MAAVVVVAAAAAAAVVVPRCQLLCDLLSCDVVGLWSSPPPLLVVVFLVTFLWDGIVEDVCQIYKMWNELSHSKYFNSHNFNLESLLFSKR